MITGHISTASFALAGAGVALGIVGLVIGGDDGEEADTATVQPLISPTFLGLQGRF